ncbi:MAG: hypothetical protein HY050_03715 [Actinobacteria bacterium]|nr:hypothetical protein [Actinomycetota bacterium]
MALTRWIPRKSFEEAMVKAENLKRAVAARERRNSLLFTEAQENFRRELLLHPRDEMPIAQNYDCPFCQGSPPRIRPSRSPIRVRITRK